MSGERSKLWPKAKTFMTSTCEVVGVETSSTGIPIALLADGKRYVGNAMITLGGKDRDAFWKRIDALGSPRSRLLALHKRAKAKWVKPGLIATVRHLRGEEKLRHAVILGVSNDPSRRSR
jgi:ATP-dependent DNA ligase